MTALADVMDIELLARSGTRVAAQVAFIVPRTIVLGEKVTRSDKVIVWAGEASLN